MSHVTSLTKNRPQQAAIVGCFALALCMFSLPTAANATSPDAAELHANAARSVYEKVANSANPDEAVSHLSDAERELFIEAITPTSEETVQITNAPRIPRAAGSCRAQTVRGQGKSHVGIALYDFWTTGQVCWNGGVSSATYLSGGGSSGAVGWLHTGSDSQQGVINGWGYAAGTHRFQFNVGGVIVQSPVGCARVVGSPGGALTGQVGTCGIG